jgi:hypothetical protein
MVSIAIVPAAFEAICARRRNACEAEATAGASA